MLLFGGADGVVLVGVVVLLFGGVVVGVVVLLFGGVGCRCRRAVVGVLRRWC